MPALKGKGRTTSERVFGERLSRLGPLVLVLARGTDWLISVQR